MKYCPKCNNTHNKPGLFCSRTCANSRIFSEDSNNKKSLKNKEWAKKNPEVSENNIKRASAAWMLKTNVIKRYCSVCKKLICKENKSGLCKKHFEESDNKSEYVARRKNYVRKKVFNRWSQTEVQLLSSLEIRFYEKLEKTGTRWLKPPHINYNTPDGVSHRYFPDFHLPDTNEYIEIKGYYWPSDKIKMDLVQKQHSTLNIKILFSEDI
jgi:hypothetical protein